MVTCSFHLTEIMKHLLLVKCTYETFRNIRNPFPIVLVQKIQSKTHTHTLGIKIIDICKTNL